MKKRTHAAYLSIVLALAVFRVFQLEAQRREIAEELSALEDRVLECGRKSQSQVAQALRDVEAAREFCGEAQDE